MSFRIGEMPNSRTGTSKPPTQLRKYWASGSTDTEYVKSAASAFAPAQIVVNEGILFRQDISIDSWAGSYCEWSVPYSKQDNATGSMKWSFDGMGGTVNIKASKSTVARYPNPGATDHKGAIGVNGDEVEGCEIVIPALKFVVEFSHPQGIITLDKAFQLGDAAGIVNSDPFFTKPAGSFIFMGATGSDGTDAEATISYNFAYSKNLVDQVIGGIAVAAKQGWDYAWIEFKSVAEANKPARQPLAVHVERVYDRVAFAPLFGFG